MPVIQAETQAAKFLREAQEKSDSKRESLTRLLESWIEEARAATPEELAAADEEWKETMRSLDADRGGGRKLFPDL